LFYIYFEFVVVEELAAASLQKHRTGLLSQLLLQDGVLLRKLKT
jgi:hypothetical protein